jgi:hypothetical protein
MSSNIDHKQMWALEVGDPIIYAHIMRYNRSTVLRLRLTMGGSFSLSLLTVHSRTTEYALVFILFEISNPVAAGLGLIPDSRYPVSIRFLRKTNTRDNPGSKVVQMLSPSEPKISKTTQEYHGNGIEQRKTIWIQLHSSYPSK